MTYSSMDVSELQDNLSDEEISRSVNAILERRHYSVLRHVVFMFTVEGVSRAFSHQLVRHHAGHDFEQRSQHYRRETGFDSVVPSAIGGDITLMDAYNEWMRSAQNFYNNLLELDIPREDARFVLPNGVETQLVWTANLNGIVNFVQQRACRVNTDEIKQVAVQVRNIVSKLIPEMSKYLGPTCFTQGICFEGEKFYKVCNRPWKSPTVLWRPNFPSEVEFVKVGGRLKRYWPMADEEEDDNE